MRLLAFVAVLSVLAGCVEAVEEADQEEPTGTGRPQTSTSTSPETSTSATPSSSASGTSTSSATTSSTGSCSGSIPGHCDLGSYIRVFISLREGGTVDVPLPHGDRCLPPEGWVVAGSFNATATLRTVDRGQVMTVVAQRNGSLTVAIDKGPYPTCQTFRADPWSVDPDPEDGSLPVNATVATAIEVDLHDVSKYCYTDQSYEGTAGPGWTTLPKGQGMWVCQ